MNRGKLWVRSLLPPYFIQNFASGLLKKLVPIQFPGGGKLFKLK